MEGIPKSFWASIQSLSDVFHRVFRKQFPRLIQLFLVPAPVIDFRLDAVLDDEPPAFLLCAAGLTLETSHKLGKFGSGTRLRVNELLALGWGDVNLENLERRVARSIWHQVLSNCKAEAPAKPVPMDSHMAADLLRWRRKSI